MSKALSATSVTPQPRAKRAPVQRRIFHLVAASILPFIALFANETPMMIAAIVLAAGSVAMEVLRRKLQPLNDFMVKYLRVIMKDKEKTEPFASTSLLVATAIIMATTPKAVYIPGLFFTSIGDPCAAFIGERWGKRKLGDKSLEGTIAFFVGALAIGTLLWAFGPQVTYPVIVIGVAAAAIAELLPLFGLDDNFKVPLASCGAMMLARQFF